MVIDEIDFFLNMQLFHFQFSSVQSLSATQWHPTLCNPMAKYKPKLKEKLSVLKNPYQSD